MFHLNVRVAWHDNKWDGTVCGFPGENAFCVDLDRIRQERDDSAETKLANTPFSNLAPDQLPPCKAEGGAFMNTTEWVRVVDHPYKSIKQAQETPGHLLPTNIKVPPFTTFAVPFNWMLRESQGRIDNSLPEPLPPDEESPFNSAWVFSRKRQEALSHLFFKQLTVDQSLVFFYTKSGHPLGDAIPRLLVGVGEIEWIAPIQWYESSKTNPYPLWDRLFRHSIRPDGHKGFLLPYHDYLKLTGDPNEDTRRRELLSELVISPEISQISSFSFAGELSPADVALSVLVKCLDAIRKIQEHGIVAGPWERREEWLNEQIGRVWKERGAFPGTGTALEALGMRLGTALFHELHSLGEIGPLTDPWPLLDSIFREQTAPPQKAYIPDVQAVAKTWNSLSDDRRALLQLLSRFSLSTVQARRWFDPTQRNKATRSKVADSSILENPYRIVETDLGDAEDHPISLGTIDRGLLPDSTISAKHPVPEPSRVQSSLDGRRVRAALVSVLRHAAENGDALLSEVEALGQFSKLDLAHPCVVPSDWLPGNENNLAEEIERVSALTNPKTEQTTACLQLTELRNHEAKLASILSARARKEIAPLNENWQQLLVEAIKETGGEIDKKILRHQRALTEQADACVKPIRRQKRFLCSSSKG